MARYRIPGEPSKSVWVKDIPVSSGTTGEKGDKGDTGNPGPNEITTATSTNITGVLKGSGSHVAQASAGTDFETAGAITSHQSTYNHALLHSNTLDHNGGTQDTVIAGKTTLSAVKADSDISSAISLKHSNTLDHSNALDHSNSLDHNGATQDSAIAGKEPANSNIQTHVTSAHAPSNAQKNSDILKAEIEAKLTGELTSHTHAGGSSPSGVFEDVQISILQSDGTLNAASGAQTWCGTNKTTQDVFTLAANSTYRVRGQWIVNTGATSHTTAMVWSLSGATVASFEYQVILWNAAVNAIATAQSTTHVSGVASKAVNAASAVVYTNIRFEGIMVTGTGGTVTPQVNFSVNPTGTNLMKRGSWTSFSKLGADTMVKTGGWA